MSFVESPYSIFDDFFSISAPRIGVIFVELLLFLVRCPALRFRFVAFILI